MLICLMVVVRLSGAISLYIFFFDISTWTFDIATRTGWGFGWAFRGPILRHDSHHGTPVEGTTLVGHGWYSGLSLGFAF